MALLGVEHRAHLVGHGPHAFADLAVPGQPGLEADAHVPIFIRRDPTRGFDLGLRNHGARFHVRVQLVAGAIEEARVDEDDAFARDANAFFEVDRRAALLVHDADLERVGG